MSTSQEYEYCPYDKYKDFKKKLEDFNTNTNNGYNEACSNTLNGSIISNQKTLRYFKKLIQYLDYYNTNDTCETSNSCRYINYWLNDKVRNLYELNTTDFHFFPKYASCDKHKKKFKCTSCIYLLPEDEFKSINEIYELYDAYYIYRTIQSKSDVICNYANSFIDKHNNLVFKCNYKENKNMCHELGEVRKSFENDMLETLKICKGNLLRFLSIPDAYAAEKIKASEVSRSISPMPVLPSIIGISLILLFLYKFTPIGSLLLGEMNQNKIISNNLDEQNHEFLYNSEEGNSNYRKRPYNIAYKCTDYS
ncbi:PIR Superfamily Protein [Plasmodium ovale curtisi]|uniref:PIR Superfamily Protein n=1 Tax=Plasmodium ovale curtisi TaxID=864141 RepID=A0A1A8WPE3_PLAOA|nr:PIR Superfamily Protein [Plasmodium ovale curtisi]SBS99614.1 PIR Superfamily Protein [Plasmodium ovale curtisi]